MLRSVSVKAKFPMLLCVILFTPVANSAYAAVNDPAAIQVQTLYFAAQVNARERS
jgi:hypothetical protein